MQEEAGGKRARLPGEAAGAGAYLGDGEAGLRLVLAGDVHQPRQLAQPEARQVQVRLLRCRVLRMRRKRLPGALQSTPEQPEHCEAPSTGTQLCCRTSQNNACGTLQAA